MIVQIFRSFCLPLPSQEIVAFDIEGFLFFAASVAIGILFPFLKPLKLYIFHQFFKMKVLEKSIVEVLPHLSAKRK